MKKRAVCFVLSVFFLLFLCAPAFAEVTTFGFDDSRTRMAYGTEPVLWPAWQDNSGVSYSQPLILKGWDEYDSKILVVAVTGNNLRGYVCTEPTSVRPEQMGFQQNNPLWSIQLTGNSPTKSHPTLVEKDGKKYVYIGTDAGYLHIIDITNFNQAQEVYRFQDLYSSDIVSAPLVLNWHGHEVVVYTAGNTGEVHLANDPMKPDISSNLRISVGSGRTSSTPAPVLNGQGFVVGLDRGASAQGEFQIYKLEDILTDTNGKVGLKSSEASLDKATLSSVVASFSVDGNKIYFGDQWSNVYGYNLDTNEYWYNSANQGIFSNRSPALTPNTVYFPATGQTGEAGKVLSVDRSTHQTNWATAFDTRAQTAPVVWVVQGGQSSIIEGTSGGYIAVLGANNGVKTTSIPLSPATGGSNYATGISGEISISDNWLVIATDQGVTAWYAEPMDIQVVSLDPGCPQTGGAYKAEPGQHYTATAVVKAKTLNFPDLPVPLAGFNEFGGAAYKATLKDENNTELPKAEPFGNNQYATFADQGAEVTVKFDWTAGAGGEQYVTVAGNLDYPANNPQLTNAWPENSFADNLIKIPVSVAGYDVKVNLQPEQTTYTTSSSTIGVKVNIVVTRKDNIPGDIQVKVTGSGGGYPINQTATLAPGQSKTVPYSFPAGPGTYTIRGEAQPVNGEDVYQADNTASTTITVRQGSLPPADSKIRVGL